MALERQLIQALLSQIAQTREDEISCDECLAGMAEFAETQLVETEVPVALERIRAHLSFCSECAEEYELLLHMLAIGSE